MKPEINMKLPGSGPGSYQGALTKLKKGIEADIAALMQDNDRLVVRLKERVGYEVAAKMSRQVTQVEEKDDDEIQLWTNYKGGPKDRDFDDEMTQEFSLQTLIDVYAQLEAEFAKGFHKSKKFQLKGVIDLLIERNAKFVFTHCENRELYFKADDWFYGVRAIIPPSDHDVFSEEEVEVIFSKARYIDWFNHDTHTYEILRS